jgi:mannuronan 5-epimerase
MWRRGSTAQDDAGPLQRGSAAANRGFEWAWLWTLIVAEVLLNPWPACAVEIRWAASSHRIYVTGPGMATLSEIKAAQDQVPLDQVASGVWHLRANLVIEEGAQLALHGTGIGGDVDQLRLQSNNATNANSFVFINADWGSISIRRTSISSWDDAGGGPDIEYGTFGRAFVGVRSKLAADDVTPLESRMDIIDSDIGYLGHDDSEAYGLTWKVIGAHPDPARSIYDYVNVYGDILNSRLHHNFFGVYTFGHYGGRWATNEVDHNVGYGFDPHDDSDYVVIESNNVHDNGWDGIIASMRCDHLIVRGNVSRSNGQNGIILHRSSSDCVVENNQCLDNGTTGIVLTGDWRCIVRSNLLVRNFEAGLRLDLGSADNLIEGNVCASNVLYGFHLYKGSDTPELNDDGRPKRNRFANNLVQNNGLDGINLADSDDNTFATNAFYANGNTLRFVRGFRNRLDGNDISGGVTIKTFGSPFDAPVTYISNQPALRVQVDAYSSTVFEDAMGRIFDPEEKGVATSVKAGGSRLTLTAEEIGTTSMVIARRLWARAAQGTVLINPTAWTNGSGSARQWMTRADSQVQSLTYTVGDLHPNRVYTVRKGGLALMTLSSGSTEAITFADVPGTTNEVLYSIEPGMQVFLEKLTDGFVVSWTGERLQRATSLSPPNWQDVPITNGQLRTNIRATEPMEFFRALQP